MFDNIQGTIHKCCIQCTAQIRWRKHDFLREDQYPDWEFILSCDCGDIKNHSRELEDMAMQAYKAQYLIEARKIQNNNIDHMMHPGANAYLEQLCRDRGIDI
jgi:hypothetical protein